MIHTLGSALRFYFQEYLARARGASPHTMAAYRQTFSHLCEYLKRTKAVPSARRIRLTQITPLLLLEFLEHLENPKDGRGNSVTTRNLRLAALRSFFGALPLLSPRYVHLAEQVRALPFKRGRSESPDYLEREELRQVFASIDRQTSQGMRDLTLLLFMYNTGARASEAASAKISWLSFQKQLPHARILGKGGRERICPLWEVTVAFLKHYLGVIRATPHAGEEEVLFTNVRGRAFTRWGIWDVVRRRIASAAEQCPTIGRKHLTAHSIRHSLAVHLQQAGVDLTVIRSWLGHIRLQTTRRYARVRIQDSQAAVERFFRLSEVFPHSAPDGEASPALDESVVRWLESL